MVSLTEFFTTLLIAAGTCSSLWLLFIYLITRGDS